MEMRMFCLLYMTFDLNKFVLQADGNKTVCPGTARHFSHSDCGT